MVWHSRKESRRIIIGIFTEFVKLKSVKDENKQIPFTFKISELFPLFFTLINYEVFVLLIYSILVNCGFGVPQFIGMGKELKYYYY